MFKYIVTAFILVFFSCEGEQSKKTVIKVEGFAQGTTYHVTYVSTTGVNYQRSIDSLLIEIDNSLSTYQPRSIISKFNQASSTQQTDKMFNDVFMLAKEVYKVSNGAFDPTVAPVVNAWGFGFKNSNKTDSLTIDSLMKYVDFENVVLQKNEVVKNQFGLMLDFNAIAQGYSVDVLANFLKSKGIFNYLVEVGGELIANGRNGNNALWRVGIDRPIENLKKRELEAIINIDNKALATSGNYRKFYEKDGVKYSHTINPKTGYPVQHSLLSATVVADNCGLADAYATAFMVLGLEKSKKILEESKELEALLIFSDEKGELQTFITDGLKKFIELNPSK